MNTLRTVGIVALAIVMAVIAINVLTIALALIFKLVTLVLLAGVLFACFVVARSVLGKHDPQRPVR